MLGIRRYNAVTWRAATYNSYVLALKVQFCANSNRRFFRIFQVSCIIVLTLVLVYGVSKTMQQTFFIGEFDRRFPFYYVYDILHKPTVFTTAVSITTV